MKKNKCIDDCKKDNIYQYEYQNKCYATCPLGTQKTIDDEFLCETLKEIIKEDKDKSKLWEKRFKFIFKKRNIFWND